MSLVEVRVRAGGGERDVRRARRVFTNPFLYVHSCNGFYKWWLLKRYGVHLVPNTMQTVLAFKVVFIIY